MVVFDKAKMKYLFGVLLCIQLSFGDKVDECKPPCLYIANLTSILRVPLNKTSGKPLQKKPQMFLHSTGHIRSLGIDQVKQEVYWGDLKSHTINKSSIDGTEKHSLFQYAIGHPQGIAIDWSSDNIYWTDSLMDVIEVADTRGFNRKVLFDLSEEAEPRGIVAHPVKGLLFWTDWGKTPKIERSSLSGGNRTTIVSQSITWPNDLAIDYAESRLYWVDAKLDGLYSTTLNGDARIMHHKFQYNEGRPHPYSLAYSPENGLVYISDWHTDSVYSTGVLSNESISLILSNKNRKRNIGQVRLLTNLNQTAINVCEGNECSHMCLKSGGNASVCDCPTGKTLSNDKKTCMDVPRDYEMYFADSYAKTVNHLVKYKGQPGFKVRPLSVPTNERLESPLALDYDPIEKNIYWTDSKTGKTYRMQENGKEFKVILNHKLASYGLAVDKISKLLYWFENQTSLVMSDLEGKHKKTLLKGLKLPRGIALYEEKGYIYFSDLGQGYIHRLLGDGTKLFNLRARYAISATGLAVDKVGKRVYWCDHNHFSIESTDLNFKNHRKLVQKTIFLKNRFWLTDNSYVVDPFSVDILGDRVFWSDSSKGAIYSIDKHSGADVRYVTGGLDHPRDIHVYRDYEKNETRKIFYIEYLKSQKDKRFASCSINCPSESVFDQIPEPSKCPAGYKEANYGSSCSNCSDAFGGNFKCGCKDWQTCAQRGYGRFYGCHVKKPFMLFKVRECVQVVKPGYCPFMGDNTCIKSTKGCRADEDCGEDEKCCKTSCSQVCRKTIKKPENPCTKDNGGCSHFCVRFSPSHKCLCPDGWFMDLDGKTCTQKKGPVIVDICKIPSDHGPCQSFAPMKRWFYNDRTKHCEEFYYGGCGGNKNNYKTKDECENRCTGVCPKFGELVGTCVVTNRTCMESTDCKSGTICCQKGCGKECVQPVKKSSSRCLLPKPSGVCKPNAMKKWFYERNTKTCRMYVSYSCHTAYENSFDSQDECANSCAVDICKLIPSHGPCKAIKIRFYYDSKTRRCKPFRYGGCPGNANNFPSVASCEKKCAIPAGTRPTASLKPVVKVNTLIMKTKTTTTATMPKTKKIATKPTKTTTTTTTTTMPKTKKIATKPTKTKTKATKTTTTITTTTTTVTTTKKVKVATKATTKTPTLTTVPKTTTTSTIRKPTSKPTGKAVPETAPTKKTTAPNIATLPLSTKTVSPSQAIDPCASNPCKNKGVCSNKGKKICDCVNYFGGKYCEIDVEKGAVSITFKVHGQVSQKEFMETTVTVVTKYCLKKSTCFQNKNTRKRRESVPYYEISEKDIRVFQYQQHDEKLQVDFAIINPNSYYGEQSFMTVGQLKTIVVEYDQLSGNHNMEFEKFETKSFGAVSGPGDRNKKSSAKIVIGILVAFIVLCVLLGAVWYVKKRRFEKDMTMTATSLGPVSFENHLYDDIHSHTKVQLPEPSNEESPRYVIPSVGAPTTLADYANIAAASGHVLSEYQEPTDITKKAAPSNWVQFPENEEEPKKVPIANFVTPSYQDPYDMDELPPVYTSNTGTTRRALPVVRNSDQLSPSLATAVLRSSENTYPDQINVSSPIKTETDC